MKRLLIYIIVALTVISGSCKKDKNDDGTPVATTKMSCKIGGTEWNSTLRVTQFYDNKFSITGTALDGKIISIVIFGGTEGTYQLATGQAGFGASYKASASASTEDIYTALSGTVVITKVDATNNKISGTFQFSAYKPADILSATPLKITEGVFSELGYVPVGN